LLLCRIAVRSLDERRRLYEALGLELSGEETVPEQKVKVAFLPVEGTRLELLEPTAPDSPIAGFIEKRGEGLHHLCLRVDDVGVAMERLRAQGFTLLSSASSTVRLSATQGSSTGPAVPDSTPQSR